MPDHPPITAIVVSRNEAEHLKACLPALRWVDQLIVVDMHSTDGTSDVAARWADVVLEHPFSPIVEPVRVFAARHATSDWLLFVDPDERYPQGLVPHVREATVRHEQAGILRLPWAFYFRGKRLTSTVWGQPNHSRMALIHRDRCRLRPLSLRGFELLDGYTQELVESAADHPIEHYWMDSYPQLIRALGRYIINEGAAQYPLGKRFSLGLLLREPLVQLKWNLLYRNGLKDGLRGITLSLLYSAFLFGSALSLLVHQVRQGREEKVEVETEPVGTIEEENEERAKAA